MIAGGCLDVPSIATAGTTLRCSVSCEGLISKENSAIKGDVPQEYDWCTRSILADRSAKVPLYERVTSAVQPSSGETFHAHKRTTNKEDSIPYGAPSWIYTMPILSIRTIRRKTGVEVQYTICNQRSRHATRGS